MQSLPFGRIYYVLNKFLSTIQLAKEFYYFVHIPPFSNELIKHKSREVDAMHKIKIRVFHRLYRQIFKETMLNKMPRFTKDDS
jgi:hypothetical protein